MRHIMSYIYKTLPVILMCSYAFGEVSLGGYFEPQLSFMDFKDSYRQLNSNKLRIDLQAQMSDDISFTGNFNYMNYNGHKEWNMLDFIPDRLTSTIPLDSRYLYSFEYKDENKLDNAYLRMYSSIFTVTIGRQQISVGSGYAWNPTDLFNDKDILDPTYEQPGVDGLRLDAGISDDYMLTFFYLPEKTITESGKLLRFTGRISHFDYALSAGQKWESSINYPDFHKQEERRDMLGFDITGELFGVGCWTENAYNFLKDSKDYRENVVGVDYTFFFVFYIMTEYFHTGLGEGESKQYSFDDWMKFLAAINCTVILFIRSPIFSMSVVR